MNSTNWVMKFTLVIYLMYSCSIWQCDFHDHYKKSIKWLILKKKISWKTANTYSTIVLHFVIIFLDAKYEYNLTVFGQSLTWNQFSEPEVLSTPDMVAKTLNKSQWYFYSTNIFTKLKLLNLDNKHQAQSSDIISISNSNSQLL